MDKRYNVVNNITGWLMFVISAIVYIMTAESTASFWDCPEFIISAFKLEVGHPPGNTFFNLTGRFFANFAGGDVTKVALAINIMTQAPRDEGHMLPLRFDVKFALFELLNYN